MLEGGLGPGNIGVLISRHGTGKLAIVTTIAIDHALEGRNTLHVALNESISDLRAYDDKVFEEIAESLGITNRAEVLARIERHKQIYSYRGGGFTVDRLTDTVRFLTERAEFRPEMIELQGWPDFREVESEELRKLKALAEEHRAEIWCPAHLQREDSVDESGIPDFVTHRLDLLEVVIALEPRERHVDLRFVKIHDGAPPEGIRLTFDPRTMLLRWR